MIIATDRILNAKEWMVLKFGQISICCRFIRRTSPQSERKRERQGERERETRRERERQTDRKTE